MPPQTVLVDRAAETDVVQRRTLRVLVTTQILGGFGLAAGVAVGALLAQDLLDGDALTGLPSAGATAGGALAALPLSRLMSRSGRRPGLALGYLLGATGAAVVVVSAAAGSFALLLAGMVLFGAGNTASLLARYAAADLAQPAHRGRALSTVLFATTFGAVAGPTVVEPAGTLARSIGLPDLAGPFVVSIAAYTAAAVVITTLLRPDPLLVARAGSPAAHGPAPTGSVWPVLLRGPALIGVSTMVGAQFVMVAMMTMTPVHMIGHGHGVGVSGLVISVHIAGMYLFSPVGGWATDRFGRAATIRAGAATLGAAGLLGAVASPRSAGALGVALFLLGLGWSLALVGGSALLTDTVPLAQRAQAQGRADLFVGLAGAAGGLGSGLVFALSGFAAIGLLAAAVAVALVGAGRPRAAAA
jgi:MFS family permease